MEHSEHSGSGSQDFHGFGAQIRKELAARIPSRERIRVLDIGTGMGNNVTFLANHLSKNSEIWTIDPSKEVLSNVRSALGSKASNVRFVRASADKLEFNDHFFDFVVSVMVMHHMSEVPTAMGELARVLKEGGRLVIVDYKPEAARTLPFQSRHHESDFFPPEVVGAAIEALGMKPLIEDFGNWYLVDAKR